MTFENTQLLLGSTASKFTEVVVDNTNLETLGLRGSSVASMTITGNSKLNNITIDGFTNSAFHVISNGDDCRATFVHCETAGFHIYGIKQFLSAVA